MQPHKLILRRLRAHAKLVAGGSLTAILLGVGLVASIGWVPHASMTVTDTSFEVRPDGVTIRQSADFTVYNNGLVEIDPVIALRRDATLVSTCAGSEVLTQAQVDQLTQGRYIDLLGHNDAPVIGRPQANYFVVMPQALLLPGQHENPCRITYDVAGAVDQPHALLYDGIFPGGMIPLALADITWDEPRAPLYVGGLTVQPAFIDGEGNITEDIHFNLRQPGEATYVLQVKRDGRAPELKLVCTGDRVVAVTEGDTAYISLQGKASCDLAYTLVGKPANASLSVKAWDNQSVPKVIGDESWLEE